LELIHVTSLSVVPPYSLDLTFEDGKRKRVNLKRLLSGPVFKRLKDPVVFAEAYLDPELGTVVWPNGADLAPEFLYDCDEEAVLLRSQ
jgi:hypothetical protein